MPTAVRRWKELATPAIQHLKYLADASADGDILHALAALDELCDTAGSLRRHAVREAKFQGATWEEIGGSLGMSRQAAWERFKSAVGDTESSGSNVDGCPV